MLTLVELVCVHADGGGGGGQGGTWRTMCVVVHDVAIINMMNANAGHRARSDFGIIKGARYGEGISQDQLVDSVGDLDRPQ